MRYLEQSRLETESKTVVARGWEREEEKHYILRMEFQFRKMKKFWKDMDT